jgi:predicted ArsR family transcriptional regulator
MYRHVLAASEPCSAGEVADAFSLHRTVARSHLEKLVEAGLLGVSTRRKATGGRPAKVYSASPERVEIQLPARRYESLSAMLVKLALKLNGQAAELAREVGWNEGRELASRLPRDPRNGGRRTSLTAAVKVLEDRGCLPSVVEAAEHRVVIEVRNCLYLEVAEGAPEIVCGLSAGMLCGLLGADLAGHHQTLSITDGAEFCRHEFSF